MAERYPYGPWFRLQGHEAFLTQFGNRKAKMVENSYRGVRPFSFLDPPLAGFCISGGCDLSMGEG